MYPNDSPPLPLSIRSDWPPLAEVPFANLFFGGVFCCSSRATNARKERRADRLDALHTWARETALSFSRGQRFHAGTL